jgi:hypothetical protein
LPRFYDRAATGKRGLGLQNALAMRFGGKSFAEGFETHGVRPIFFAKNIMAVHFALVRRFALFCWAKKKAEH